MKADAPASASAQKASGAAASAKAASEAAAPSTKAAQTQAGSGKAADSKVEKASEAEKSGKVTEAEKPAKTTATDKTAVTTAKDAKETAAKKESTDKTADAKAATKEGAKADAENELSAAASPAPITDGDYIIRSSLGTYTVLDVAGAGKANGTNVQVYTWNNTDAQKWHFKLGADGYYTITSAASGKVLDVSGAGKSNGTNIQTWASNGTAAQKWSVVKDGKGYRIESALKKNFVVDVAGADRSNGTNVWTYAANGTKAQLFYITSLDPEVAPSTAVVEDGVYTVRTGVGSGRVLDVSGASMSSGANVQQYASNGTYAQRFYVESDGTGFYRVFNIASGLALDVSGADVMPGANVQQYGWNGTDAQLWAFHKNADGTYRIVSKASGKVLDISGASTASGANLQMWDSNGTNAQKFTLSKASMVNTGINYLAGVRQPSKAIGLKTMNKTAGTPLELDKYVGALGQKFEVAALGGGKYSLQIISSGMYVAPSSSGAIVQVKTPYEWTVSYSKTGSRRGLVWSSDIDNIAIATTADTNKSALAAKPIYKSTYQAFLPVVTGLLDDGLYYIYTALGNRVLSASSLNVGGGANVRIETLDEYDRQMFYVTHVGNGYYSIRERFTDLAVDTQWGGTANGTNVWQYEYSGAATQLWKPEAASDGTLTFTNKATGMRLNVSGNTNAERRNVNILNPNSNAGQRWSLQKVTNDPTVNRAYNQIYDMYSPSSYIIAVDLSNTRLSVFTGYAYNWKLYDTWEISCGAYDTPTITGSYNVGGKGYVFGSDFSCYYYTQIWGDYLFHSTLYYNGTFDILDGRLGEHVSHGCVRNPIDKAEWIYDYIPGGTRIWIYW